MTTFGEEDTAIERLSEPTLSDPIMIEGLPGVGFVGKLVVEQLSEEQDVTPVARIVSEHLAPQVTVDETGLGSLSSIEINHVRLDGQDLLLVCGDQQAQTGVGYYRITNAILDAAASFDVATIYALGGVPVQGIEGNRAVIGAVSAESLLEPLAAAGVEFREEEPAGGIVGVSGLLLGLGARREQSVACLMGETTTYPVDRAGARVILEVLESIASIDIGVETLGTQADELEALLRELEDVQEGIVEPDEEPGLRYID